MLLLTWSGTCEHEQAIRQECVSAYLSDVIDKEFSRN